MMRRVWYLAQMLRNERLAPRLLAARQDRLVRELIGHSVDQVPFYRDLYAGIDASSIRGDADLVRLPIIDKSHLRAAGASWRSASAQEPLVRIRTSGSTGMPLRFEIDPVYNQWRKAQYLRPYVSNGRRLTEPVMRLRSLSLASPNRPLFKRLGLLPELLVDLAADPEEVRRAWQLHRPRILQGYPSALRVLAQTYLERNRALEPAPRLVFTDSELLLPETRELLERAFHAPVIDVFGTFETDNIAYQCGRRAGYHVTPDSVIIEIVRDGVRVESGEIGELVVTVLRNRTTPFIRYNLHDLAAWATEPCGCGRTSPLLEVFAGRANDLLTYPDGRELTPMGICALFSERAHLLRQYQMRQTGPAQFDLLIVPTAAFTATEGELLLRELGEKLGPVRIDIRLTDRIAADPSGKLRAFIREPFEANDA
jgi:phenylacetate-CoA ligase